MSDLFNLYAEAGSPNGDDQPQSAIRWGADEIERLRGRCGELEESAKRWNALINCARIRPLGSAGLNGKTHDTNGSEYGNRAHLGLELWTVHSFHHSLADERKVGVEWLNKFADKAIDANAQRLRQQAAESELQQEENDD